MKRISNRYLQMNRQLHAAPRGFGGSGFRWSENVVALIREYEIKTMLDYGCGQSTLQKSLEGYPEFYKIAYQEYDPCIIGKDTEPHPSELVTCTDVLEHIEPKYLDAVLLHILRLTQRVLFLNIAMHAANKRLPNGKNAHLIQKSREWWLETLSKYFVTWSVHSLPVKEGREHKDFNLYLVHPV